MTAPTTNLLPNPLSAQISGRGESVVCLHSSAGSGAQWRELLAALAPRCRVVLPDLHGHGRSPGFPPATRSALQADAAAVVGLAGIAQQPVHLVGHSYGAAVALQIALRHPQQVRSLSLYEPVAFGLLREHAPRDAALAEIEDIAGSVAALVNAGALDDAARVFVGYWGGAAAWAALDERQRLAMVSRMPAVPHHFDALFAAPWQQQLQRLQMPVLLMQGGRTRAPARRVAKLLADVLPRVQRVEFRGAGHLGPMTHAGSVLRCVTAHLDVHLNANVETQQSWQAA